MQLVSLLNKESYSESILSMQYKIHHTITVPGTVQFDMPTMLLYSTNVTHDI